MSHARGRGADPKIMSSNVERRECVLVQPRICSTKTGPTGQIQRVFQEEDGFDFRDAATRRLISAELRRFSPDSVTVHPPDVVCRSGFFSQESEEGTWQVQTFGQPCVQSEPGTIEKRKNWFSWVRPGLRGLWISPMCRKFKQWKAGSDKKSSNFREETRPGRQCDQKTWYCVRSSVGG